MKKRKSKKREGTATPRTKGSHRQDLILQIVKTDSTFKKHATGWIGKCLHCNTTIHVGETGQSSGTIEHIVPAHAGGSGSDMANLALACSGCNNRKGIDHDPHYGKGGRADQVISSLLERRKSRMRDAAA